MFKQKNKASSSSNNPESVKSDPTPPVEPVTTNVSSPSSGDQPNPGDTNATGTAQKPKLYAVSHLLKKNSMQLTEAPWCIGKTAMSQEDFDEGKDAWFKKDKKEEKEESPDDENTEDNK